MKSIKVLLAAACLMASGAQAQTQGNLNLIVGFAPGGSADSVARIIGLRLQEKTGRTVIVENRPGAGANIATKAVIAAKPDANVLLVTTAALPINETLYRNKGFAGNVLLPVSIVATTPEVFAVNKDDPSKTLAQFAEAMKGKEIVFGTAGIGTGSHIAGEYFLKFVMKAEPRHVPFRGGPEATAAVMGGHVPMVVSSLSGFASQVASGELTGLVIAAEARNPVIPKVPTFAEAGYPPFTSLSWVGFFAPPGTPSDAVAALNKQIDEIAREPAISAKLRAIGFDPMYGDVPTMTAFMTKEYSEWKKRVEALDIKVD